MEYSADSTFFFFSSNLATVIYVQVSVDNVTSMGMIYHENIPMGT